MRALLLRSPVLRSSHALERRASGCRGSCVRVCSSAGDKDGVWGLLESVKKVPCTRRGRCAALSATVGRSENRV
jgi:hypothetical protein